MAKSFSATVDAWVLKSRARMLAVFQEGTKRMVSIAQSRIPVDTGFARASIRASLTEMPQVMSSSDKGRTIGANYLYDPGPIILTIANAKLGQPIYIGWTANYVGYLETGHSQQAPSGFIRVTALMWPQIIKEVIAEAKARASRTP